ncbi:MAG: transposase, partial [Streptomyces sp.]|nr:transposase [Streptomyces sp.]
MLFYRAAVDLSRSTLNYVAGLIRRYRKTIGSTWRLLNPGQQALLVLVYLRKGETFPQLGAGFGISTTTAWRYVEETVMLLSARSPKLVQALRRAKRDALHYLVLDGTLIPIDRVAADRSHFSGKHRVHGMNVQVIATPDGTILWTSGALPGKTHDLTAARIWGILRALEQAAIITLADKAYQGAEGPVRTPYGGFNESSQHMVDVVASGVASHRSDGQRRDGRSMSPCEDRQMAWFHGKKPVLGSRLAVSMLAVGVCGCSMLPGG